ncbi:MAG: 30S ribosomal protein S1 [Blastocatellia bacterium]|nr:30S ribosomal protein S1 [Blastocatellia bacterium]
MATENVNQTGASAAADSAKEEPAKTEQSAGPDISTADETSAVKEEVSGPETGSPEEQQPSADAGEGDPQAAAEKPSEPAAAATAEPAPDAAAGQDFGAMLESYEKESAAATQEGEIVRGIVVDISEQNVLIDIGYKSEGVVPREEFLDHQGQITVERGDEVDVLIKSLENQDGYAVLSRADALRVQSWERLRRANQTRETVQGRVMDRIKGGLRVEIDGVSAFLPGSQVDSRPVRNLEAYIGQEIEVRVIKLNRKRGNVVVSRKAVLEEESHKKKSETLGAIEEGVILEGTVKNITDYGAFIDLGGIDGLLHIIDMSWGRIQSPTDVVKVGDHLQVKVLKFDRDKERISLGYKQLMPDPWQSVTERYPQDAHIRGNVVSLTDYGAFIEIEPGVEGLVHVTEMTWSKRLKHPSKLLSIGQEVETIVLEVDSRNRRISLGIKQITEDPWETLPARYHEGSRVSGKVRSLTDFGAFVEIEDGIDGLVHVSDISWTKRIKHPSDVLKKGQQVDAIISNIDVDNRRLSLSIKDLEPNAWDRFFQDHKPGDIISGRVVRFASFGAFVEIEEGIEGLCHVSELSDERVEKPEDAVKPGQTLQFKVLKLDQAQKKIGLSARAVGKEDDPEDVRTYHETGSGMAKLGDIAKLLARQPEVEESKEEPASREETESESAVEIETESAASVESEGEIESAVEIGAESESAVESEDTVEGESAGETEAKSESAGESESEGETGAESKDSQ